MHDLDRIQLEANRYGQGGLALGPDSQELQLASELLEVSSEQELDQFLGDLISSAAGAAGRFVRSPTGRALGGILKDAARRALPVVAQAIGDYAVPGRGGDWGRRVGTAASRLFELELEGLSDEDKEFELARRYVRWARGAARTAAGAAGLRAPAHAIARAAAARSARQYAPGMLSLIDPASCSSAAFVAGARPQARLTGRWVRHGGHIVVHL